MPAKPAKISVFAYNFGPQNARGKLQLTAPQGWKLEAPDTLVLAPMERREFFLTSETPMSAATPVQLQVSGDFGYAGKPVLSVRLAPDPVR